MPRSYSASLLVIFSAFAFTVPAFCQVQTPAAPPAVVPIADRIVAMEKAIEAKRIALGVPGAALVVVQNDKVIYTIGLGFRNAEKKLPVTPDTLFAIGSSTKAFTALAVVMAEDDGKLSLTDSPHKFLPYFKLQDKDADQKITLRDLLCHDSGLARTDLIWYTGVLTRTEAIAALADVKPTAKLGEKFQYQNLCFAAAGESVAAAQKVPYETLIAQQIFQPLHMTATTFSADTLQNGPNVAQGYLINGKTKAARPIPVRPIVNAAPAGGINSSANDMAQWLRLLTGGGEYEGKRVVSAKGFEKLTTKQMAIAGSVSYGLGWFVRDWDNHKVVEHGGNIDGYTAQVAFMPDQKIGFVLLTNANSSPLGASAMDIVWSNLVGRKTDANPALSAGGEVASSTEVGTYSAPGFTAEVALNGDKLTFTTAGQPPYPLTRVAGRRYKLGAPAPDGFSLTFRPVSGKPGKDEAFLEQPQGNMTLAKLDKPVAIGTSKEIVGKYVADGKPTGIGIIEVAIKNERLTLLVGGQPPYPLVPVDKDTFSSPSLPDTYRILVRRDPKGKVSGLLLKQPEGDFPFVRKADEKPFIAPLSAQALETKMIAAYGGEKALRRHTTRITESSLSIPEQGLTARVMEWAKAPGAATQKTVFFAPHQKNIATMRTFYDGKKGGSRTSFTLPEAPTKEALSEMRQNSRFSLLLDTTALYKSVVISGTKKIGDEETYVVEKTPASASALTEYVSTKTFRVVRRDQISVSEDGTSAPVSETYSDFRLIDGELVAFRIARNQPGLGDSIAVVQRVRFNTPIADTVFTDGVRPLPKTKQTKTGKLK